MPLPPALRPDRKRQLDGALIPGERVRWSGQPRGRSQWASFGIYLFAIPWTAFSLFWERMALIPLLASLGGDDISRIPAGFSIVFPLFGLPFVVIGLGMMAAPFLTIAKTRRTVHAVTDRRLLSIVDGRKLEVKSAFLDRIGPVERSSGRDGWGTLKVQTMSRTDSDGDRRTERLEWIGIPDVVRVERMILEAQAPAG